MSSDIGVTGVLETASYSVETAKERQAECPRPRRAMRPAHSRRRSKMAKRVLSTLLRGAPVTMLTSFLKQPVIALCYHTVTDASLPHVRNLYKYKTPTQFESDILFLKARFHIASYEELITSPQPGSVFLSFDDGLAECFTQARPILKRHQVPCTFFVSPPHLDNKHLFHFEKASLLIDTLAKAEPNRGAGLLQLASSIAGISFRTSEQFARWITAWVRTIDCDEERTLDTLCGMFQVEPGRYLEKARPHMTSGQVRTLLEDGFTIGAHGLRHVALGAFGETDIRNEILQSCADVIRLTNKGPVPFAFPYDADGIDRKLLRQLCGSAQLGLLFNTGVPGHDASFVINRQIVDAPALIAPNRSNLAGYFRGICVDEFCRGA